MTKKEVLVVLVATHLDQPYKLIFNNSGGRCHIKKLTSGGKIVVFRFSLKFQIKLIKIFRRCSKKWLDFCSCDALRNMIRENLTLLTLKVRLLLSRIKGWGLIEMEK